MKAMFGSLRGRFLVAIMLWAILGTVAIWIATERLFADHVELHYHEELEVHIKELAALTELDAKGSPFLTRPLSDPRFTMPLSGFYWQITRDGHPSVRSTSMTSGALDDDIAHKEGIDHRIDDGPTGPTIAYGMLRPADVGAEPVHLVMAIDQRHMDETINAFSKNLALWLSLLAAALIASGAAVITFGLRPLRQLGESIAYLRSGAAMKLEGRFPAEITPLVSDLNAYADRTTVIVERGRVQAGNLAHALRTPLAIVTDEAERMGEVEPESSVAQTLLQQFEQMRRHISYHLARARSGGSQNAIGARANPAEVLPPLISAMRRIHPDKKFIVTDRPTDTLEVACDPEDLSEIVSNLLDNAGKWAVSAVHLICVSTGRDCEISVIDDGVGLPVDDLQRVFDVGVTSGSSSDSAGLGLAIARDIARDYWGDVTITNIAGGGLKATLRVPKAE